MVELLLHFRKHPSHLYCCLTPQLRLKLFLTRTCFLLHPHLALTRLSLNFRNLIARLTRPFFPSRFNLLTVSLLLRTCFVDQPLVLAYCKLQIRGKFVVTFSKLFEFAVTSS